MKNLALSLLIAGSLVMPLAFAADSDMKADTNQTTEAKHNETMNSDDGHHAKKHRARHHRGHKKHHGGKHHKRHHHKHHMQGEGCDGGGCASGQCN